MGCGVGRSRVRRTHCGKELKKREVHVWRRMLEEVRSESGGCLCYESAV